MSFLLLSLSRRHSEALLSLGSLLTKDLLRLLAIDLLRSTLLEYAFLLARLSRRLPKDLLSLHLRLLSRLRLRHLLTLPAAAAVAAAAAAISTAVSAASATLLSRRRTAAAIAAASAFTLSLAKTVLIQTAKDEQQNR